jgi:hypothetical protein
LFDLVDELFAVEGVLHLGEGDAVEPDMRAVLDLDKF